MTKQIVTMTLNGEKKEALAEPRELLIYVLREKLGMTGAHVGCETSHCGACTVEIEGIGGPDNLHVLQESFKEHHGLQCGYCTPGMITRAHRLLKENPNPTEEEVRFGISGNICRCTGYQNIVKSILSAAAELNAAKEAAQ